MDRKKYRTARPVRVAAGLALLAGVVFGIGIPGVYAGAELVSGERIPVGGDGRGPLSAGLSNHPVGAVHVYGSSQADLFLSASRFSKEPGLFLYRWIENDSNGIPVFGDRVQIAHPGGAGVPPEGAIFETADGSIYGFWLIDDALVRSRLDKETREFVRLPVDPIRLADIGDVQRLAVREDSAGEFDLVFSVGDGVPLRPSELPGWRTPEYHSFDGAGIWRGNWPYVFLYGARLEAIESTGLSDVRLISPTRREARISHGNVALFGGDGIEGVVTGSWYGNFGYYSAVANDGTAFALEEQILIPGKDGIALRHPSIRPTPVLYPFPGEEFGNLIAGGEGSLYFYRFSGRDDRGAPVYHDPVPLPEENADLFPGTLPVLTVIDWDGDGIKDIISGNSQGEILFFRNAGTNRSPSFAPGVLLEAAGEPVIVQQGYWGIQGPQEARWGYSCPTVIDWTGNGLPDILLSDATARHTVLRNIGSPTEPQLERARPLFLEGIDLHGTWRVQPGVGQLGDRMAYIALDEDDQFRLYWKIDDFNVKDGGKLKLEDGSPIGANFLSAGGTGRLKIVLTDWDGDGVKDLLVGTPRHASVPNPETGLPQSKGLPGAAVLLLRNVGTNEEPVFEWPSILHVRGEPVYFGQHACSPAVADIGPEGGPHLLVGDQEGRIYFFNREDITWER